MVKTKIKLSVILILLLISTCINVNAADSKVFSMTDGQGYKNGEVTIYIKLEKELAFASVDLTLEYDTSKLEYVKYTALNILNNGAMNIVKNNSDTGKIAIGYVSNPEDATTKKKPDQMLSITFKVKGNESDVTTLKLKCTTLKNDAGDSIEAAEVQSKITVIGKGASNNGSSGQSNNNNNPATNVVNPQKESNSPLPYTGSNVPVIVIPLSVLIISSLYFYRKYSDFKGI